MKPSTCYTTKIMISTNLDVSLLVAVLWFFFVGKARPSRALRYIGGMGKVLQSSFWKIRVIIINDFELGKQLFRNPVFCGKETNAFMQYLSMGSNGLMSSTGKKWTEQKRFCFQHLKEFGFGTKSMETFVQNEVNELIEDWVSKNGESFSPNKSFYIPILNSIWAILAGDRASAQNKKLIQLVQPAYEAFGHSSGFPSIFLFGSKIKPVPLYRLTHWTPFFGAAKYLTTSLSNLHTYFKDVIETRKKNIDLNDKPKNLVDAYLQQIQKTTDPDSQFFQETGETNLIAVMTEFFMAGGDTTANQLAWAVLYLVKYPDIQEKIQHEIDTVVGKTRRIDLQDRNNCPFTEAFMWELLRFIPISSVSLPHAATEDTNIGPYFVEKETLIFLNIYNINHDPSIWGDPENFRPQRFLSEDGATCLKHDSICTFSSGLRKCFGDQLAKDELFLFIGAICQRFVLKPDPSGKMLPSLCEEPKLLMVPKKFKMVAIDRLSSR